MTAGGPPLDAPRVATEPAQHAGEARLFTGTGSAPLFEIADDESWRGDLAQRRELKFALPGADVGALRTLLSASCERKAFAGPVSTVRSIYFDDYRFSAAQENLDGLGRRRKLRLRWYDELRPGCDVFFEQKWRASAITGKRRYRIASRWPLAELPYGQIVEGLASILPDDLGAFFRARPEPTVVVQYRREHFVARDSGLRLTIDYDLVFYDETAQPRPRLLHGLPHPDLVVLEAKAPVGQEQELRALLRPFAPRATRCSKYVTGCQLLGLLTGVAPADR